MGLTSAVAPARSTHGQAVVPDPKVGPHAADEARHASTVQDDLPAATTAIIPRQQAPLRLTAYNSAVPTPFHREVFGFAPYWSITHNQWWNYRLLSTVAYFGITLEGNGYFNTTVSGWNEYNGQDFVNMANSAHANGDRVVVVVKQFNKTTLNMLLSDTNAQQIAITNIIQTITDKNLDGVNIDFEPGDITGYPNMQSGLTAFMTKLNSQVHAKFPSAEVSIDTYSGAASWDLGFFKIGDLAPVVDAMFIMAYDMGFSNYGGHAAANAPLCAYSSVCNNQFKDCTGIAQECNTYNDTTSINEYLSKAPASKILLGVPYYGYKYSTVGNDANSAIQSCCPGATADNYANITSELSCNLVSRSDHWDSIAQSPWVAWYSPNYPNDPCGANLWTWRELYYDNPTSLAIKYDLVNQSNLRGAGMWALGYDDTSTGTLPDLWNVIATKLTTTTAWDAQGGVVYGDPGATSMGAGSLDAFVIGQDRALWHRSFASNAWQPWESMGGVIAGSGPGAASAAANTMTVFGRGQDNGLWYRNWDGAKWSGWQSLGGILTSGPDAISPAANAMDVIVRGQDNGVYYRAMSGGTWQPWSSLGGVVTADPTMTSRASGQLDVFVRGKDNALWHRYFDGTKWQGWESLGGILASAIGAASCGSGHLDVFAVGQDGALYTRGFNGTTWSPWTSMGGKWLSGPAAICEPTTTTIDVFEQATDRGLWRTSVNAS
jgi:spore germination protein YaaH